MANGTDIPSSRRKAARPERRIELGTGGGGLPFPGEGSAMTSLFDSLPAEAARKLKRVSMPEWVDPMLATRTHRLFSDEDWIFERKLTGERCLAHKENGTVRILGRGRRDLSRVFPEVAEALLAQEAESFILDGKIVAFQSGVTSLPMLQKRMRADPETGPESRIEAFYYAFDLLHLQDRTTLRLSLRHRKSLLFRALKFRDPLRFSVHVNGRGEEFYDDACEKGWEGIVAKDARSPYLSGRSKHWLMQKCILRKEMVVAGYTDPRGSRIGFGALLVGYYDGGLLRYAAKVGTGFDDDTLRDLSSRLKRIRSDAPPFAGPFPGKSDTGVHWVKPRLVCEVGFTEWTGDGHLRHPRFVALAPDVKPLDVVREKPLE